MPENLPKNQLFYGDNLDVLGRHIADESVDLVYLDPPFNSNANYNVLFAERDGTQAAAQIKARSGDGLRHLHRCSHLLQLVDDLFQLHAVVAKTLLPEINLTHGLWLMSLNPVIYAVLGTAIHEILFILKELIVHVLFSTRR